MDTKTGLSDGPGWFFTEQTTLIKDVSMRRPLNEVQLLERVRKLKGSASLAVLKSEVAELRVSVAHCLPEIRLFEATPAYLLKQLDQIAECLTLDRAKYYVERLEKGLFKVKTSRINDINLNRWKEYEDIHTDSLWIINRRDNSGVHTAQYWGNFVPQIPQQMLKRYTKKGELVVDVFLGSGTTLVESQRLGRHGLGVELQPELAERTRQLISAEPNPYAVQAHVVTGDSATLDFKSLLAAQGFNSAQLLIMHPPYFDIIKFSDDPRDLSNAASIEAFLAGIGQVVQNIAPVLDKGRDFVLVIGDKYSKGEWIPLGFEAMNEVLKHGFSLKSIIVKNFEDTTGKRQQKELWRYRALAGGFYIFKHEYIFLFQKK